MLTSSSIAIRSDSSESKTLPNIAGTNKRNRKLDELAGKCSEAVQGTVRGKLQNSFRSVLGGADWKISEDPADADRQSLLFA